MNLSLVLAAVFSLPGAPAEEVSDGTNTVAKAPRTVTITAVRSDYDRKEGVLLFDENVMVKDPEYQLNSRQLYVFLDGTNELKRIVAIGDVAITNQLRDGSCSKATFTRASNKVVMYGDAPDNLAKLNDRGKNKSTVQGTKITFWIDTEQVEVESPTVTIDTGGKGGAGAAKQFLGR